MSPEPLLQVRSLCKSYAGRVVLRDVSFTLERGSTLAVIGPSGSGKTTLARCLTLVERADSGLVTIEGSPSAPPTAIQLIPQQPAASLNPRFTAGDVVAEPLVIQKHGTREERSRAAGIALQSVGLDPADRDKPALAFSGGERQRLAIARAIVAQPKVLILDESLSSLDLSIQAQVANLLLDLQARLGIAYILISHDLFVVSRIAAEIAVMDGGELVERGSAAELLARPRCQVTRELVSASLALSASR